MPRGIDITTDVEKPGSRIRTLYIEEKDFYHKFAVFEFDRFNWGNLKNAIKSKKIPDGQVNSFCKLCNYQTTCSNNEKGIEKPLSILEAKRR